MKTSILTSFLGTTLILSFAVGCGKDVSKSGGGAAPAQSVNVSALNATAQQAWSKFSSWYNSSNQGPFPGVAGTFNVETKIETQSSDSNCDSKTLLSIGGYDLFNFNYCSNLSMPSTSTSMSQVTINQSMPVSSNSRLANIYQGSDGQLTNVVENNGVYTIYFQKSTGTLMVYTVDTRYHSSLNPVLKINTATGKKESLNRIY